MAFLFCSSCLQHEQPFPRHVWEWQAPTSTPGCPGLSAAGTALPFGHNSSSRGLFFSLELGCCGLSCCSSAFTQVLASPTSTRGEYKLGWARHSSEFKGFIGVEAHPATTLSSSRIVKSSLMTAQAQVLSSVPNKELSCPHTSLRVPLKFLMSLLKAA